MPETLSVCRPVSPASVARSLTGLSVTSSCCSPLSPASGARSLTWVRVTSSCCSPLSPASGARSLTGRPTMISACSLFRPASGVRSDTAPVKPSVVSSGRLDGERGRPRRCPSHTAPAVPPVWLSGQSPLPWCQLQTGSAGCSARLAGRDRERPCGLDLWKGPIFRPSLCCKICRSETTSTSAPCDAWHRKVDRGISPRCPSRTFRRCSASRAFTAVCSSVTLGST